MVDKYKDKHIDRVIDACTNLYEQENSICMKCHNSDKIICVFCFCPLYDIDDCGGNPVILSNGVKDCSNCMRPHTKEFVEQHLK